MNPERGTHDPNELTTQRDAARASYEQSRTAYVDALHESQRGFFSRMWDRVRRRRNGHDEHEGHGNGHGGGGHGGGNGTHEDPLQHAQHEYQTQRDRFIQLSAREAADARVTATTTDTQYRTLLAEEAARFSTEEMATFTQQRAELADSRAPGIRRFMRRHPVVRAGVGWGLNAAAGASMFYGALPLSWTFLAARGALGAYGTKGLLDRAAFGLKSRELGRNIGGMNHNEAMERYTRVAAARARQGIIQQTQIERDLLGRIQTTLSPDILAYISANPNGARPILKNWKKYEQERQRAETAITTAQANKTTAEADKTRIEGEIAPLRATFQEKERIFNEKNAALIEKEAARAAKELERDAAITHFTTIEGHINPLRGPLQTVLVNPVSEERVKELCRDWKNYNRTAMDPRTLGPQKAAAATSRDNTQAELENLLIGGAADVPTAIAAYTAMAASGLEAQYTTARTERDNKQNEYNIALGQKNTAEAAKNTAETEKNTAQTAVTNKETELTAANTALTNANTEITNQTSELDTNKQLIEDQAIIVHDLLMGGNGRRGITGRPDILLPHLPGGHGGIIAHGMEDFQTRFAEGERRERNQNRARIAAAIVAGGLLTYLTMGHYDHITYDPNKADPLYSIIDPRFQDHSSATGLAEAKYIEVMYGGSPSNKGQWKMLSDILLDQINPQSANYDPAIAGRINRLTRFIKMANPQAFNLPDHPDLFQHGVQMITPPLHDQAAMKQWFTIDKVPGNIGAGVGTALNNIGTGIHNGLHNTFGTAPSIPTSTPDNLPKAAVGNFR